MKRKTFLTALAVIFAAVCLVYLASARTEAEGITRVVLPPGYRIERYISGLTFPTAVTWDESGVMYVSEAAVSAGEGEQGIAAVGGDGGQVQGRIVRVAPDVYEVVVDGLNAPVTDVKIRYGKIYIAHRDCVSVIETGTDFSEPKASLGEPASTAEQAGDQPGQADRFGRFTRTDLLQGLPFGDHFTGEIAFGPDGSIYVGHGTVTNSGVVGEDNFQRGWAASFPEMHDVPPMDVVLSGMNFTSRDPRTSNPFDNAVTGGFLPFGTQSTPGQKISGKSQASGVIYRISENENHAQVYAWGLRNPFGIGFAPDGRLIAIDQGYQDRGSRPVANAPDPVYEVKQGAWYGWPDYAAGESITDPKFKPSAKHAPLANLLQEHPKLEKPLAVFQPGTGLMKFGFAPEIFDPSRRMYVAAFGEGDISCALAGTKGFRHGISAGSLDRGDKTDRADHPRRTDQTTDQADKPSIPGGCVYALDMDTGQHELFAYNESLAPAGRSLSGFNHPVDVKFGPDGSMYVVDFGVIESDGKVYRGVPGTGAVWKISVQRSELKIFREKCTALIQSITGLAAPGEGDNQGDSINVPDSPLGQAQQPQQTQAPQWDPDYTQLQAQVEEYISGLAQLGQEWGVYFKDLTSGKTFGVNPDLQVPAASTVKVPVVLYTSVLVSRGELSWNETVTYNAARDWRGGAGIIQYTAKDGDTFTIRELAEKSITHSDNVAWKMLERRLGKDNLINFMKEIGGTTVYPGGQNISTPRDNAIYMEAALHFSKTDPEGEKLMFDLANTIWNTGLNRYITEVTVAHKEGDIMGVANDVGVIYAERPYILSIMSKGHEDVEAGFEKIGEISRMIFDYQNSLLSQHGLP